MLMVILRMLLSFNVLKTKMDVMKWLPIFSFLLLPRKKFKLRVRSTSPAQEKVAQWEIPLPNGQKETGRRI